MNQIKEIRSQRGFKQADLAKILNVSQGTLSNWERGEHDPDSDSLIKLSDLLGVTTDALLGKGGFVNANITHNDLTLGDFEYALFGEVRELDEEDKAELLRNAQRFNELRKLRNKQNEGRG